MSSNTKIKLNVEQHKAIETLVDAVTSHPILSYPDFSLPFYIHVDASESGLGSILYQDQNNQPKVIAYASRTLVGPEKKYHSGKLEFLALKWSITEAFHDYLYYAPSFVVYTDNNPLTYVMTTSKLNASGQRWVNELANYNFIIKYRPGIINRDADCLSRSPLDIGNYKTLCTEEVTELERKAVVTGVSIQQRNDEAWLGSVGANDMLTVLETQFFDQISGQTLDQGSLRKAQEEDVNIAKVIEFLMNGKRPTRHERKGLSREMTYILHQWKQLVIEDGVLYRQTLNYKQIVLPKSLRSLVYKELHDKMGHLGSDRVVDLARERVYWPNMQVDISYYINEECKCLKQKVPHVKMDAPMLSLTSTSPGDLVAIDLVHLETAIGCYEYNHRSLHQIPPNLCIEE